LDWKQKRMACFIYWIAPCFWRFYDGSIKCTYVVHQKSLPNSKNIWLANLFCHHFHPLFY
jgi:hypothetical protein